MTNSYIIGTKDGKFISIRLTEIIFTKNINLASVFKTLNELNKFENEYGNKYKELTYPYILNEKNEVEEVKL